METPHLPGYHPVERHRCPRCGRLVRVRYAADAGDGPELEPAYRHAFDGVVARLAGYPGGAIAIMSGHEPVQADWYWGANNHCGFALAAGNPEPESLINAIYATLVRYEAATERITGFSLDAFAAAPFSILAASDAGGPPLRLIAAPAMLRAILSTGSVPATLRDSFDTDLVKPADLRARFLDTIAARTRPLA